MHFKVGSLERSFAQRPGLCSEFVEAGRLLLSQRLPNGMRAGRGGLLLPVETAHVSIQFARHSGALADLKEGPGHKLGGGE